ncbi:MAG TPA: MarR family transcriptional regulator [Solirubrobacteraceae bacterium]|nr:MarR family transcriptional regulator [Solirubrobacteraceae bacterium]
MKATITDVEQLGDRLACLVDAISRTGGTALLCLLEDQSITVGQMKALLVLSGNAEPASIGHLARELSLSLPTVSRLVESLVRRGWAERRIHATDRRTRDVLLTAEGDGLVSEMAEARAEDTRVFLERLTPVQRRRLAELLAELPLEAVAA